MILIRHPKWKYFLKIHLAERNQHHVKEDISSCIYLHDRSSCQVCSSKCMKLHFTWRNDWCSQIHHCHYTAVQCVLVSVSLSSIHSFYFNFYLPVEGETASSLIIAISVDIHEFHLDISVGIRNHLPVLRLLQNSGF